MGGLIFLILVLVLIVIIVTSCIKVVPQARAYVIERLGLYQGTWEPGLHFKIPVKKSKGGGRKMPLLP